MKKFISLVLVVLLLLMCAACGNESKDETNSSTPTTTNPSSTNNESTDDTEDDQSDTAITTTKVKNHKETPASAFTYESDDSGDGIKITKYNGTDSIVVIPDKIDGKPVTELKSYLFANNSSVKGVYIPETVKSLSYMFTNNDDIEVVICEGVEALNKSVFLNCKALHTIVLGENLSEMDEFCIATCPNLLEVYVCPKVTKINNPYDNGYSVFFNCPKVTIIGEAGSYIQTYAETNGIPFQAK